MNAKELLAYNQGYNAGLKAGIDLNTEPMLRQQQNEIEFLKKEILEKHEDWKHEGQQAANARAEIEALKSVVYWLKENRPEVWEDIQKWRKAQSTCNGFCGEYECKENQAICKRKAEK